jgi:RNA polymerase-binding transcription factor DksA
VCVDCGASVGYERLEAYPTAKRCLACQQAHEKTRGSMGPSRL